MELALEVRPKRATFIRCRTLSGRSPRSLQRRSMRILLIEDDPMIGKALVRGLGDQGMTVDWVRSGAEGSAALACAEHALVLLDIGLPEMSGIEVLKAARTAGALLPVLVITTPHSLAHPGAPLHLRPLDYI